MLARLKINTATLICLAFIFRLLFVNIGIVSSLYISNNNNTIKRLFSTVIKNRRKNVEPITNSKNYECSAAEILEENSNDESLFKLNPIALIPVFYYKIECKIINTLKKITPFNKYFSFKSSHRYIDYQVFRV